MIVLITCRKCGQELGKRGSVCPHCGAGRLLSILYFIAACGLIVALACFLLVYLKILYLPNVDRQEQEYRKGNPKALDWPSPYSPPSRRLSLFPAPSDWRGLSGIITSLESSGQSKRNQGFRATDLTLFHS